MKSFFQVTALVIFLTTLFNVACAQSIVVKTDKTTYFQDDQIVITLQNNSQKSIYSIAGSGTPGGSIDYIERSKKIGEWEKLSVLCEDPGYDYDFDVPAEIKAGHRVSFNWKPRVYQQAKYIMLEEGVYRIVMSWQDRTDIDAKKWVMNKVVSNEFTISSEK
jgi:hypothetical protein